MLRLRSLDLIKSCDHYLRRGGEVSRAVHRSASRLPLNSGELLETSSGAERTIFEWPLTGLTSQLFVQRNLDHSAGVTGKLQWASQYAVITVDVTITRTS